MIQKLLNNTPHELTYLNVMHIFGFVRLFVCFSCILTYSSSQVACPSCQLLEWNNWGSCVGACNSQIQTRNRPLCCPTTLNPRTKASCLQHCNLTNPLDEDRQCRICKHGVSTSANKCRCDPRYGGPCCEGISSISSRILILIFFIE